MYDVIRKEDAMRYTHKTGQNRSGIDTTGFVVHAVEGNRALCGSEPGRRGSWSEYDDKELTCPRCIRKIALANMMEKTGPQSSKPKDGVDPQAIRKAWKDNAIIEQASRERYAYTDCSMADHIQEFFDRGFTRFELHRDGKRQSIRLYREDGEYFPIIDSLGMAYAKLVYGPQ
jgi:hypothetical protein